jgi:hypothetical protein
MNTIENNITRSLIDTNLILSVKVSNKDANSSKNYIEVIKTHSGKSQELVDLRKAANIFWNIRAITKLRCPAVFKGIIIADQKIVVNKKASVEGRLLSRISQFP